MGSPSLLAPGDSETSAPGPIRIGSLNKYKEREWDEFVLASERGTFFHLSGWKRVVHKTYGYQPRYFFSERNGKITGIAPLFSVSNWIVGRSLISVPLAPHAGIYAEDEDSEQALLTFSKDLAVSEEVDYLELRNRRSDEMKGFHTNELYVIFSTPLSGNTEANLKKLPKDTRYMIRKGEKNGLSVQTGAALLPVFYELVAQSMHRLGTPVFPKILFQNFLQEFPRATHLMVVNDGTKPISGVLSFVFKDTILPYFAGASSDAPRLAANNFMYWRLMEWAAQNGYRHFDFGRSKKNTGSFAFKSQWNMEVTQLKYQVLLVKRKTAPNFSPLNPKFEAAIRVWKSLPLGITKVVGPKVVRWFP